jgi:hypothetical protein
MNSLHPMNLLKPKKSRTLFDPYTNDYAIFPTHPLVNAAEQHFWGYKAERCNQIEIGRALKRDSEKQHIGMRYTQNCPLEQSGFLILINTHKTLCFPDKRVGIGIERLVQKRSNDFYGIN